MTDETHEIRLTRAQTEAHAEGDSSIMAAARRLAKLRADARRRWNITASRSRLPAVPTRVYIVSAEGRILGHED